MFWAESLLILSALVWSTYVIFQVHDSTIAFSCMGYVWFLFSSFFLFEYLSSRRSPLKLKQSLGVFWNERTNAGNGIVIGSCLVPLTLLVHTVIVSPSEDPRGLLPYFDASISTPLVILVFYSIGSLSHAKWLGSIAKYILSLSFVSYAFALWTKGNNQLFHFSFSLHYEVLLFNFYLY